MPSKGVEIAPAQGMIRWALGIVTPLLAGSLSAGVERAGVESAGVEKEVG